MLMIFFRPLPVLADKKSATDEVKPLASSEATEKSVSDKVSEDNTSLSFKQPTLKDRLGMFPTCNAVFDLLGV